MSELGDGLSKNQVEVETKGGETDGMRRLSKGYGNGWRRCWRRREKEGETVRRFELNVGDFVGRRVDDDGVGKNSSRID